MNKEKQAKVQFAVMTDTGEQPDVKINMVGFKRPSGMQMVTQLQGKGSDIANLLCHIVEDFGKELREKDGVDAAAALVAGIGIALRCGAGEEAMERSKELLTPKGMMGALAKMLGSLADDPDALEAMLAEMEADLEGEVD